MRCTAHKLALAAFGELLRDPVVSASVSAQNWHRRAPTETLPLPLLGMCELGHAGHKQCLLESESKAEDGAPDNSSISSGGELVNFDDDGVQGDAFSVLSDLEDGPWILKGTPSIALFAALHSP